MSLSKDTLRQPKCTRCRHHGVVVPQRGHVRQCPFARCQCWKCGLITERTRINALERQLRRKTEQPSRPEPCPSGGQQLQTDTGSSPAEVPPQPALRPVCPRPIRRPAPRAPEPERLGSKSPAAEREETTPCDPPPPSPNPVFWGEYSPVPLLHLQVRMPFPYHSNFLVNMPWSPVPPVPPVPPGLYEGSLSPLMVPPYPPPLDPEPPVDLRLPRCREDEDSEVELHV